MLDRITTTELGSIRVSYFKNATSLTEETITLTDWLGYCNYNKLIPRVREVMKKSYETYQKKIKPYHIPMITPAGIFNKNRRIDTIIQDSNIYCIDLDHISNPEEVKEQLFNLPYVWCIGLSTSGEGLWGFIPINPAGDRDKIIRSIHRDFADMGYELDEKCKDLARLRGLTLDENLLVKEGEVMIYSNELDPPHTPIQLSFPTLGHKNDNDLLNDDEFCYKAADLAINDFGYTVSGRNKWLGQLATLSTLGQAGLTLALDLSRNSPEYRGDKDVVYNFKDMARKSNYKSREFMSVYFKICKDNLGPDWVQKIKNM